MGKKNKLVLMTKRFSENKVVSKIFYNTNWIVADKVFFMVTSLFVIALVARYLGPNNYGVYNYALAFVTLFTALSTLGLDTLSVRSIVEEEEEEGVILFTGLVLRVIGGIVLTFLSSVIIRLVAPGDSTIHTLVIIMSCAMIFKSLEVIEYWIVAHQKSKISSLIRISANAFSSILKIAFVLLQGDLFHLAIIYMLDVLIIGIALFLAYYKYRFSCTKWKFDFGYAKNILSQSWYLILSGLMVTLYMQVDKVMLGSMLTNTKELGVYSAATQIANMWYFVPTAVITSFTPIIIKKKLESEEKYIYSLQTLYSIIAWMGILFGIFITLFADLIVSILYGQEYSGAVNIIIVSVWAGTFATLGSARAIWLLTEKLQKYTVFFTLVGLLVNVGLNYLWIPQYGGGGAAFATLISQIVANVFALLIFKKTRISSMMIIKAFSPKYLINLKNL